MRLKHLMVAAIAVALEAMVAPFGGVAAADGAVPLGGGAGIVVNRTYCTLTTIGHDETDELVEFTGATCGGAGSPVAAAKGGPGAGFTPIPA